MVEPTRRAALLFAGGLLMTAAAPANATAFDFTLEAIEGGPLPLAAYRGRPMLVVNTASFCGYTPQYAGLQTLHERYGPKGLLVLGVPSQDFNQESGEAKKIKEFCDANYNVTFPMTTLAHVQGSKASPFYAFLAAQAGGQPPRWNFHKYLVARDGRRVTSFSTQTGPQAPALVQAIEAALAAAPAA